MFVFSVFKLLFDGIIKGGKEAITDSSKVTEREPGYFVKYGEESETNYKTAYLERGKIVTFNPTGGQVAESIRGIEEGKVVEKLPEPTRNGYLFKGWYTLADGGDEVTENTIITEQVPSAGIIVRKGSKVSIKWKIYWIDSTKLLKKHCCISLKMS